MFWQLCKESRLVSLAGEGVPSQGKHLTLKEGTVLARSKSIPNLVHRVKFSEVRNVPNSGRESGSG